MGERVFALEGPEEGDEADGGGGHQEIQWDAVFEEVAEVVAARAIDHEVGLVANGRGEAGRPHHHECDDEGHVVHAELLGQSQSDGEYQGDGGVVGDGGDDLNDRRGAVDWPREPAV